MNVLLIDDDVDFLKGISKALRINGIENDTFSDPVEAVKRYRDKIYDVVVTDLKMPGMNGLDVLREIRSIDDCARVIILTAFDDDEKMESAVRSGAYSFYHKSVNFEDFMQELFEIRRTTDPGCGESGTGRSAGGTE